MKKHYFEIDGERIEISKELYDELMETTGDSRHERYVVCELAPRHELSLDGLLECEYPIELHMMTEPLSIENKLIRDVENSILLRALNKLEQEEREVIVALYYEGLSEREVAGLMGVHQTTIWEKKHRILMKLKKVIHKMLK